jgi:hypothetical protein
MGDHGIVVNSYMNVLSQPKCKYDTLVLENNDKEENIRLSYKKGEFVNVLSRFVIDNMIGTSNNYVLYSHVKIKSYYSGNDYYIIESVPNLSAIHYDRLK